MHSIKIQDKVYNIKIGIGALVRAERITGVNLLSNFQPSLDVFAAIGYGAVYANNPEVDLSYEDFIDSLDEKGLETIIEAYKESIPKEAKKKTVKSKNNSLGKTYTSSD